jgi:hypothetical protein
LVTGRWYVATVLEMRIMKRSQKPKALPSGISDEVDSTVDYLVCHTGEPEPLEELLEKVLIDVYHGKLFRFTSDLYQALNRFACECPCQELVTCECLKEQARLWAEAKLSPQVAVPRQKELLFERHN